MKKKIFVGAAVGTAGLVALTGATFAHTEGDNPGSDVRERVAEILGIAPEELQDAMQQARDEHREEHLAERLASAVEEGVITQAESDEITSWLDAMPDALDGAMGYGKRHGFGHVFGVTASEERIAALVERLVEAEKITEAEAGEVTSWFAGAPTEALSKIADSKGDGEGRRGRGFRGKMFGEGPGGRMFEGRFQIRPYTPPTELDDAQDSSGSASTAIGVSA